jgi:hypothetical protein
MNRASAHNAARNTKAREWNIIDLLTFGVSDIEANGFTVEQKSATLSNQEKEDDIVPSITNYPVRGELDVGNGRARQLEIEPAFVHENLCNDRRALDGQLRGTPLANPRLLARVRVLYH